ncbi:hypothetical protein CN481_20190 [Bacillus sp. AFS006103]|nr:hypothetical protein CN481_20190 [Bacillus sp. AFS006103]
MGFWDEIKKEILTEENKKKIGSFSRNTKSELSKLPIISIIGDTTQGASGLSEVQKLINQDPKNPKNWLFYYEAFMTHRQLKSGASVARGIINPIGFIVGKGIATGLNSIDDEYQKFDPKKCLLMVMSIVSKRIKKKRVTSEEIAIYAKSQYYLGVQKNGDEREYFLKQAINNFSLAIEKEIQKSIRAELFFYLAQIYKASSRMELYYRALNISRKLGFLPAYQELASILKKEAKKEAANLNSYDEINAINQLESKCIFKDFKYTYKLDLSKRVDNTLDHVFSEQSKKISETTKRLGNFFSKL